MYVFIKLVKYERFEYSFEFYLRDRVGSLILILVIVCLIRELIIFKRLVLNLEFL